MIRILSDHILLNFVQKHIGLSKDYLGTISQNSVEQFWRRFSKVHIEFSTFKLAIVLPIMQVARQLKL